MTLAEWIATFAATSLILEMDPELGRRRMAGRLESVLHHRLVCRTVVGGADQALCAALLDRERHLVRHRSYHSGA